MKHIQVEWAMSHDWYISQEKRYFDHYIVTVRNDTGNGTLTFTDFEDLWIWAGY